MSEPFFDYIKSNRHSLSNYLYGDSQAEKNYSRLPKIVLPETEMPAISLVQALEQRKTVRDFSDTPASKEDLSALLKISLSADEKNAGVKKYPFPSGGAFYPIETYILVNNMADLASGVYHYSAIRHDITKISKNTFSSEETEHFFSANFESPPSFIVVMTMVKSKCVKKYGSLSYSLALTESGHRGQNIYLASAALKLGCCPIGFVDYICVNSVLGIDGVNEHWIYSIAIGKID